MLLGIRLRINSALQRFLQRFKNSCNKHSRIHARYQRIHDGETMVPLQPVSTRCLSCGHTARVVYHTQRRITTLHGRFCLSLTARRCSQESCPRCHHPYRPEEEGRWALPHGEYSLDVTVISRLPASVILKEKRHFEHCWRMKEKALGRPIRLL